MQAACLVYELTYRNPEKTIQRSDTTPQTNVRSGQDTNQITIRGVIVLESGTCRAA